MKKTIYVALGLSILINSAIAQTKWQWAKQGGNTTNATHTSVGNGIAYSSFDGTVTEVGNFNGTGLGFCNATLTQASTTLSSDIYIQKRRSTNGACMYTSVSAGLKDKNDGANAVATDNASGDVFVTGKAFYKAPFNTSTCLLDFYGPASTPTNSDVFVASYKYDLSCVNWLKGYGDGTLNDEGKSVYYDTPSNCLYVSGDWYKFTTVGVSAFVQKVNNSASTVGEWNVTVRPQNSSSEAHGTGVVVDGDGNIVATGYFRGTVRLIDAFGTTVAGLTSAGGFDYYVLHIRPSGTINWYVRSGGTANEMATGIVANGVPGFGGVYITGNISGYLVPTSIPFSSSNICSSTINCNSIGNGDMFVSIYSTGAMALDFGCLVNANIIGSASGLERATSISYRFNDNGTIPTGAGPIITGTLRASPTSLFEPSGCGMPDGGTYEVFVLKLDQRAMMMDGWWYNRLYKTPGLLHQSNAICTDKMGYFYITGTFGSSLVFSAAPNPVIQLTSTPVTGANCFSAKIESMAHCGPDIPASTPCTPDNLGTVGILGTTYNWCISDCFNQFCLSCTACLNTPQICVPYISHNTLVANGSCLWDGIALSGGNDYDDVKVGTPPCRRAAPAILEQKANPVTVFPNPGSGIINLSTEKKIKTYVLRNFLGKTVLTGEIDDSFQINASALSNGIYTLEITDDDNQAWQSKLVIQK